MIELFFPRLCPCCQRRMLPAEVGVCLRCLPSLPRIRGALHDNPVEQRLVGRFPFEHAAAFCYYTSSDGISPALRRAKYFGQPWYNAELATLFAQELALDIPADGSPGWPFDIDLIMPIPSHRRRLIRRGYNQAVPIAETLSRHWHLPLDTHSLYKCRYTSSQVGLSGNERLRQEEGSFALRHPERLAHRHVLLVDDVLTTGATVTAAADALLQSVPGVRISILTLTMAQD